MKTHGKPIQWAKVPKALKSSDDVVAFFRAIVDAKGGGIHPDDDAAEIISAGGVRTFSKKDAKMVNVVLCEAFTICGALHVDVYELMAVAEIFDRPFRVNGGESSGRKIVEEFGGGVATFLSNLPSGFRLEISRDEILVNGKPKSRDYVLGEFFGVELFVMLGEQGSFHLEVL